MSEAKLIGWDSLDALFSDFRDYHYGMGSRPTGFIERPADGEPFGNERVLFGVYEQGSYDGSAFVLFERDGRLWEVNGSHCSCHGLEGQWEPTETTVAALRMRLDKGMLGESYIDASESFGPPLRAVLDAVAPIPSTPGGDR